MPVTAVTTDADALTMTLVGEFPSPVERLWRAFTDPRQLERFWGPPGYPSTFERFDFEPGGFAHYAMTSPQGETFRGRWEFVAIHPETGFEVLDAFADESWQPAEGMPVSRMRFEFEATASGSRFTSTTHFSSLEGLQQTLAMGAVEGSTLALNQLDIVLQDLRAYAEGKGTRTEILTDQHVRITRLINGPRELVWRAYTEPELMKQWLLGPDGWRMTVCEIDPTVGGRYRYAWAPEEGTEGEPFGFDGETLLVEPARRTVTTEHMTGTDFASTTNDLTLYEEDGATLVTTLIEYPDKEVRDMVLATGMTDGMETSYARLERVLAPLV
ncbi:SRPBCC domain-containing protein [Microbacterium sp. cx-55]|uniref:SRPBCC family protein n=1 Tax=Microbacterium sp. cx-55 TaxID=2875948 RepID=UPI001CBC2E32|nr:SRPBCC family protein [Microbacterium sp. cx-55]MBZ4487276.1 SRPBCC domain-containing protein [Microbacterium sp. cx-55]UGB35299.1 SRPBCC domain-containing protein [Microbacterium sp. cx-55]